MNDQQPTVYIVFGASLPSAVAFDEKGEIVETVEWDEGYPVWTNAAICDARGQGGACGYTLLRMALMSAEANMREGGFELVRVSA